MAMHPNFEPYWTDYLKQFDLDSTHFKNIKGVGKTKKFCVIVEPRETPLLPLVIKNFMYLLQNKGWGLIVFHGTKNETFIRNALDGWDTIYFANLSKENLSLREYNDLFCSEQFWKELKKMGCEQCLSFETDTLLLNDNIDDFIKYDYVGAPWCVKWLGLLEVGNSGLCLRNVNKMLEIVQTCPRHTLLKDAPLVNNDIYFSYWCLFKKFKVPTIEIAKKFSVETIYYENPCGMHKPHMDKFPEDKKTYIEMLSKRIINNK